MPHMILFSRVRWLEHLSGTFNIGATNQRFRTRRLPLARRIEGNANGQFQGDWPLMENLVWDLRGQQHAFFQVARDVRIRSGMRVMSDHYHRLVKILIKTF